MPRIEEKVSIIIPVYNSVACIERSVNSCLMQNYQNIEIIIVNDGSTDNTEAIIKRLVESDCRIRYYSQENEGVSSARNHGMRHATGTYILFLDSDDCFFPCAVSCMLRLQKENKDAFIMTRLVRVKEDYFFTQDLLTDASYSNEIVSIEKIVSSFGVRTYDEQSACGKLFSREKLNKHGITFDETVSNGEDGLFVLSYIMHCDYAVFSPDLNCYAAIYRKESATRSLYSHRFFTSIDAAKKMLPLVKANKRWLYRMKSYVGKRANEVIVKIYEDPYPLSHIQDIRASKKMMRHYWINFFLDKEYPFKEKLFYLAWIIVPAEALEPFVKKRRKRQRGID